MTAPTRFPYGVNNVSPQQAMNLLPMPDPTEMHTLFTDFNLYVAAEWIVSETGTGSRALTAGNGGLLLITNAAADNDRNFLQSLVGSFAPVAGKRTFFKARFKVLEVVQVDIVMGLQNIDSTPLDATDGMFFQKDDGDALIDTYVQKDVTTGRVSQLAVASMAADTFTTWAFAYDGIATTRFYIDDIQVASLSTTSTNLPDANLALSFGLQNGEAVANLMTIDYLYAAQER